VLPVSLDCPFMIAPYRYPVTFIIYIEYTSHTITKQNSKSYLIVAQLE